MLKAFEKALGQPIPYKFVERRSGDLVSLVANVDKANEHLNWKAQKTLMDVAKDSIKFLEVRHGFVKGQKKQLRTEDKKV